MRSTMALPPKLWTKAAHQDLEKMEERRKGLELWLQNALQHTAEGAIAKFLLLGRCGLAAEMPVASAPAPEELLGGRFESFYFLAFFS